VKSFHRPQSLQVAQIFNLLALPRGNGSLRFQLWSGWAPADYKSAIQQIENLRYVRDCLTKRSEYPKLQQDETVENDVGFGGGRCRRAGAD
jgi:hypothetical protein